MATFKKLSMAPIVEAVLDFQVQMSPETTIVELESIHQSIIGHFPKKQITTDHEAKLRIDGERPTMESKSKIAGAVFKSADGKNVIQAKFDGYTFNQLAPYQGWTLYGTEAFAHWKSYVGIAKPTSVTRIGLRFVNKLVLPQPVKLDEYFLTCPKVSSELPQTINEFFLRLVIPAKFGNDRAILMQTIDIASCNEKEMAIIFDVDVFRKATIAASDDEAIKAAVTELKNFANDTFFGSLTDKTVALYK